MGAGDGSEKIVNFSLEPLWRVIPWFDRRFLGDYVLSATVLPDVCPAGLLPNGTVARVRSSWLRAYPFKELISDIGCAMSWAELAHPPTQLRAQWNALYARLLGLGKTVLGSGNHFIDGCQNEAGRFFVVVHVGSRMTFAERDAFVFTRDYARYGKRAEAHHQEIWSCVREVFGPHGSCTLLRHDSVEDEGEEMVVRKGVTRSLPGDPVLIASSFDDEILVGAAGPAIGELGYSMSHGTGRSHSRAEAKNLPVDPHALRQRVIIPDDLPDGSWRLEAPAHYRRSGKAWPRLAPFVTLTHRLVPVAFMGGF